MGIFFDLVARKQMRFVPAWIVSANWSCVTNVRIDDGSFMKRESCANAPSIIYRAALDLIINESELLLTEE